MKLRSKGAKLSAMPLSSSHLFPRSQMVGPEDTQRRASGHNTIAYRSLKQLHRGQNCNKPLAKTQPLHPTTGAGCPLPRKIQPVTAGASPIFQLTDMYHSLNNVPGASQRRKSPDKGRQSCHRGGTAGRGGACPTPQPAFQGLHGRCCTEAQANHELLHVIGSLPKAGWREHVVVRRQLTCKEACAGAPGQAQLACVGTPRRAHGRSAASECHMESCHGISDRFLRPKRGAAFPARARLPWEVRGERLPQGRSEQAAPAHHAHAPDRTPAALLMFRTRWVTEVRLTTAVMSFSKNCLPLPPPAATTWHSFLSVKRDSAVQPL